MEIKRDITKWANEEGEFIRMKSIFRSWISEEGEFPIEKNRYHLYVSLACPWAQRTLILIELKKLQSLIGVSIVHPHMSSEGWSWKVPKQYQDLDLINREIRLDPNFNFNDLKQIYFFVDPHYQGRFTVPVLFDNFQKKIVNNESSDIIRMLNSTFNRFLNQEESQIDMYPKQSRDRIDEMNQWIYEDINNGVYKAGFATTQEAYDESVDRVFHGLDRVEDVLKKSKFLIRGDQFTEVDIRLFTTIIRFDTVYFSHFKCNVKSIRSDYPHIHRWLKDLYYSNETSAFRSTTNFHHIKCHYFTSHPQINPTGIVPKGPLPEI